jgi:glycosyltransferase involved in cell wall biosynthesis
VIGISLLTLVPGQLGGTETYVRGLTHALAEHGELEYRAYLPPVASHAGGLAVEPVPEYRAALTMPQRLVAMGLAAARPDRIRKRLDQADAVHYPLTIPLPETRRPYAVTLQDVLHHDRPELFPRLERVYRQVAYDRAVRRARRVIVPTAFTRDRIVELLGLDAARIRVIPLGIDHERFSPGTGDREPFLVYPARPWAHKNHARLLEAFALVRRERPELGLVLTGGGHGQGPPAPGISVRGLVSPEELAELYRTAAALVFPSLYEGFGWPPLEAMASGCPVACSDAGSLPEVTGDAARLFDPTSAEEIAAAVLEVVGDPAPWQERGLARAATFTWEAAARGHDQVYRELLEAA